jgi:Zn-dependent protease
MSAHAIKIGKFFGITVRIDQSWFIMFVFLSWILAESFFPFEVHNLATITYWVMGISTSLLFFITVLLHELSHAVTARKFNLNPENITLYIFGGLADIGGKMQKPLVEFWIALAGPVCNLIIAFVLILIGQYTSQYAALSVSISYLAYTNFILAIFNMVPAFPLDGGRVFKALIWKFTGNFQKALHISVKVSRAIAFLFIITGLYFLLKGHIAQGIWIAFIGWFLESAAAAQLAPDNIPQ